MASPTPMQEAIQAARDAGVEIPRPDERPNWRVHPDYARIMNDVRKDIITGGYPASSPTTIWSEVAEQAAADLRALGWNAEVAEEVHGPSLYLALTVTRP